MPPFHHDHLVADSILECNNLKLTQLGELSDLCANGLLVLPIRLLEDLRMVFIPERQVGDEVVVKLLRAVGERDRLQASGIGLGATNILASESFWRACAADDVTKERYVRLVGGLEVGGRESGLAGNEGCDGVRHGDGWLKMEDLR
jgi:hypothetical protein